MTITQFDPKLAKIAVSGFAIQSWDVTDKTETDKATKGISEMIEGGFQIVSCTTVVFGQSLVQTVILVKYPK